MAAESDAPEDGAAAVAPRWSPQRQVMVAALVLAVVAVAVAAQPRDGPGEPRLGDLSQHTGMSATGPPPSGLRVAWAHDPPAGESFSTFGPARGIVVGDERIRLGNRVVDLGTGDLVRVAAGRAPLGDEWSIIEGGELVVIDTLTGEVRGRSVVTGDWRQRAPWSISRWGSVTLFGADRGAVLVDDDGLVIAEVDGWIADHVDRAFATPAVFPVRTATAGSPTDEMMEPIRLVATSSGEVVAELAGDRIQVVDVAGDLAMVAGTDARIDAVTSPAAISDVPWTVRLLDAHTSRERARLDVGAREPPRLLGTFGDGTAVVAARSGDVFTLWGVAPDGTTSTIASAQPPPRTTHTGLFVRSTSLNAAVVTGDVLVVSAGKDGIVGLDPIGNRLWALDAPTFAGLRADGGYIAVLPDDGGRIRVVQAADGKVVASVPSEAPRWDTATTPLVALDGHVGLGYGDPFLPHEQVLGATTWLDLGTGEPATLEDVVARFVPGGATGGVDRSWTLHGTVVAAPGDGDGEAGGIEPVLTRPRPGQVLELVEPGEGFTQFTLSVPETPEVFGRGLQSLGGTADRLAVWSESFEDPATAASHVLDRTTGDVTTIPGLQGVALIDDVLLALDFDENWTAAVLVGIDAATGQQRWSGPSLEPYRWSGSFRADHELVVDLTVARVTASSVRDGAQAWSHASATELTGHSVLGPHHVVVATTDGEVVALDRTDGEVAWRMPVGTPIASLTGAGDHIVVGTHDGLVVHLDGRGREVQRVVVGSGPVEAVAALGDTVVATVDGRVVGLRADGTGITRNDEVELP